MRRIAFALPLLALALTFLPAVASAAVVKHFSLEQLTESADVIVHAKVSSSSAAWDAKRAKIWTTHGLDVTETIKGEFAGVAQCHTRGGTVGRKGQAVAGEAKLTKDREYLLFLWKDSDGRYRCVGMKQGAFKVTREAGKDARAKNAFKGIKLVNAHGKALVEKATPIAGKLSKLIADVKASLPKQEDE